MEPEYKSDVSSVEDNLDELVDGEENNHLVIAIDFEKKIVTDTEKSEEVRKPLAVEVSTLSLVLCKLDDTNVGMFFIVFWPKTKSLLLGKVQPTLRM